MYRDWPFFRSTLDLIQMVLAKADPRIVQLYDQMLVPDNLKYAASAGPRPRRRRVGLGLTADAPVRCMACSGRSGRRAEDGCRPFGEELRKELEECIKSILLITNESRLLENDPVVRRAVEARLPFCDTLNILQGAGPCPVASRVRTVYTDVRERPGDAWRARRRPGTVLVLKRLRNNETEVSLNDTLTVTIQGVVAAMGNSG